jgi:hypothetical protein
MNTKSYSDLSDSATTFDPEEQLDRDIDERMKGMSKEEAVRDAIAGCIKCDTTGLAPAVASVFLSGFEEAARAAIAAADKWDAEQRQPEISAGQDAAIQDELDHPPASIMEEGKVSEMIERVARGAI